MKRIRLIAAGLAAALLLAAAGAAGFVASLGPPPLGQGIAYGTVVVDREGRLLRPYAIADGRWRLPVRVEDVDPRFVRLLIAYEDKRFHEHAGVDPRALLRAAYLWAANGRIVSGASTLTMQVARLLEPRSERSLVAKLRQMVRAIQIERALRKEDILSLYLALAPYGGNLEGVRAASLAYFGKEPRRLALHEAALLVALPQSPEMRRPDRAPAIARRARDRVLVRAGDIIPADEIAQAQAQAVPDARHPMPMLAPQAADQALAAAPDGVLHRLTIDAPLQAALETLARERAQALGPDISIAILAVDHASGEVRARVASAGYFDARRAGQVDMTQAVRSPGSALKPFIYGLGFEDGLVHPETLIEDRPARFGRYAPENFDLTFQGTVTVRRALQMSLNVPAVVLLEKVGASRLTARLAQAGGAPALPKGEVPGLAMGLGGVGITLTDLTMLYGGIARLGTTMALVERAADLAAARPPRRLLDPAAAWYTANVLQGTPPPENAPHHRVAFKTGTSYGFRDAWAVGFDGLRTVGVWVGRPDGMPVPGMTGRNAAAPVLFDAFARSGVSPQPLPPAPRGVIFASTARLPRTLQRYEPEAFAGGSANAPRIVYPPHAARVEAAASGGKTEPLALKIAGGAEPLTVMVNGRAVAAEPGRRVVFFDPGGPGFVRLTVMDAKGLTDSIVIRVQ
ncbi:MAG: penicillin-binding protein 1C [Pseudorhodoplanes sp.]|nr:penicillin-binding protein 1C [Pseudorhodoplanes sp.]